MGKAHAAELGPCLTGSPWDSAPHTVAVPGTAAPAPPPSHTRAVAEHLTGSVKAKTRIIRVVKLALGEAEQAHSCHGFHELFSSGHFQQLTDTGLVPQP